MWIIRLALGKPYTFFVLAVAERPRNYELKGILGRRVGPRR